MEKMGKVVVRRDGKIVHALNFDTNIRWWTKCGCQLRKGDENYSEHDYDVRFVINCKRCRKALGMSPLDSKLWKTSPLDPGVSPIIESDKTVMGGKDVFYEIRMKDGTHEFMYDCVSAQEAAEIMSGNMGIPLSDIECIHKLEVVKIIKPTVSITFEE